MLRSALTGGDYGRGCTVDDLPDDNSDIALDIFDLGQRFATSIGVNVFNCSSGVTGGSVNATQRHQHNQQGEQVFHYLQARMF